MDEDHYHVKIEKDPDSDWLVVQCIEHPQALSQGKTVDECLRNIREALELVLESKKENLEKSKLLFEVPVAAT